MMKRHFIVLAGAFLLLAASLFVTSSLLLPPQQGPPPADTYECLHPSLTAFAWLRNSTGHMLRASLCYDYQSQINAWNVDYISLAFSVALWRATSFEIAEGFAVAFFLFLVIPRLRAPESLKRRVALAGLPRQALMAGVVVGLGIFVYAELFNILYAATAHMLFLHLFYIDPEMPVHALLVLIAASVCFGILNARESLSKGLKSGATFLGVTVFGAQMCILIFDTKEMTIHVTNFSADWILFGYPILSNWSVLVVASCLALLGLIGHNQSSKGQEPAMLSLTGAEG